MADRAEGLMGMFDFFLSDEKRIAKQQRQLTNRDKQPEDREASARWLADNGSPKAIVALLTRFDMNLENQLNDRDEKEFVYGIISTLGDAVQRPLERHITRCKQIAMPIRLYTELKGEQGAVEQVFNALKYELEKGDAFKPEKKAHLLVWLAQRKHPGAIEACTPFLTDFDESVRCGAAEVLAVQGDDAARVPLEVALANDQEESNRLKVRLAELFRARGWALEHPDEVGTNLPSGFAVRDRRIVTA